MDPESPEISDYQYLRMATEHVRTKLVGTFIKKCNCEYTMTSEQTPAMQRIYNRIWLLALAALLFFFIAYVGWGLLDLTTLPAGPAG